MKGPQIMVSQKQPSQAEYLQGVQGAIMSKDMIAGASGQDFEVPPLLAKAILDAIKKGDLETVRTECEKLGNGNAALVLPHLHDQKNFHNPIFYASLIKEESKCVKMVEYLIQNGVDAATVDSLNQTALYYACREGKLNLVEILVKQGCMVNHTDSNVQTPLFYACREGHLEVVRRLIQAYKADPDQVDKNG